MYEVIWTDGGQYGIHPGDRFKSLKAALQAVEKVRPGHDWRTDTRTDPEHPQVKEAGGRPVHRILQHMGFYIGVRATLAKVQQP
jgi:hypothetical protein